MSCSAFLAKQWEYSELCYTVADNHPTTQWWLWWWWWLNQLSGGFSREHGLVEIRDFLWWLFKQNALYFSTFFFFLPPALKQLPFLLGLCSTIKVVRWGKTESEAIPFSFVDRSIEMITCLLACLPSYWLFSSGEVHLYFQLYQQKCSFSCAHTHTISSSPSNWATFRQPKKIVCRLGG